MKILLVDDHALIREALHGVLKKLKRDAVVFDASTCGQAMQVIASHPDISLVLLDLTLPDRDGFSLLAELRERYPPMSSRRSTLAHSATFRNPRGVRCC